MKFSEKGQTSLDGGKQLFGVDFHDGIQCEEDNNAVELASEFGLNLHDVKKLKRKMGGH
jgi:hypothetical protein